MTAAPVDCDKGTRRHTVAAHDSRGLPHNPWSWGCRKRYDGEPYCVLVTCPTCEQPTDRADS